MAVRLLLASGARRDLVEADGAHIDGPFFLLTRWDARLERTQTVLTLRSEGVVGAPTFCDSAHLGVLATPRPILKLTPLPRLVGCVRSGDGSNRKRFSRPIKRDRKASILLSVEGQARALCPFICE